MNTFIDQLLGKKAEEVFGVAAMPQPEQTKIMKMVEERLQQAVIEVALGKMSEEQFAQVQQIIAQEKDEQVIQQKVINIAKEIPGLEQEIRVVVLDEVNKLKAEIKK